MNRMTVSVLALALAAVAGSASAGLQDGSRYDNRYDNQYDNQYDNDRAVPSSRRDIATVLRVDPMYDRYRGGYARQECWNEQYDRYDSGYYRDSNGRLYRGDYNNGKSTGGAVLGAIIGGALGNQVGKGDGRKAATVAGAVIGGTIGANQGHDDNNRDYDEFRDDRGVVRRCRMVNEPGGAITGYNVTYRYAGRTYESYMRNRPGRTIRVMVDVRPEERYRR